MGMAHYIITLVLVISTLAVAEPKPLDPMEIDKDLTAEIKNRKFCDDEINALWKKAETEKETLKKAEASGDAAAIQKQKSVYVKAREAAIQKIGTCGHCASRPIEPEVVGGLEPGVWYLSDGTCVFPQTEKHDVIFKTLRDRLTHAKQFSYKRGGFFYVLELLHVDPKSGKILPELDELKVNPTHVYIAARGPEIPVLGPTGFGYYFEVGWKDDASSFLSNGVARKPPLTFKAPKVPVVSPSGKELDKNVSMGKLGEVFAQWYVTKDGNLRYRTAADFGKKIDFIADEGEKIMLTTVAEMYLLALEAIK
jgi:hypothetical protein